jgi:hypothetical protein
MSSFTEKLSITQVSLKPRRWRLDRTFRYYIGEENSERWVELLAGFECDAGSIPQFAWWLESPVGQGAAALFLHDGLYCSEYVPRAESDYIMLEGLQVLELGWLRRNIIYSQVRVWGGFVWDQHTKESVIEGRKFIRASFDPLPLREFFGYLPLNRGGGRWA